MVRALDLVIADKDGANGKGYELSEQFKYKTGKEYGFGEENVNIESADALAYYNAVMGENAKLTRPENDNLTDMIIGDEQGNIAKDNYVLAGELVKGSTEYEILEVTFIVFLNGWDAYCFDACKGQSFNVSLGFTTDK